MNPGKRPERIRTWIIPRIVLDALNGLNMTQPKITARWRRKLQSVRRQLCRMESLKPRTTLQTMDNS